MLMTFQKFLTATLLSVWALTAFAQSDAQADRRIERRAIETVIWGMPAVNTELMLQAMLRNTNARENEVVYWSRPVNWKNQTLTPNPDSIYFMTFVNTRESGPLVIDIPPADNGSLAVNIVTTWQMPLEDAGPEGADAHAHEHVAELADRRVREHPLDFVLDERDRRRGERGDRADPHDDVLAHLAGLEERVRPGDDEDARGDHGRGVDERADGGRTGHSVGEPNIQRNLRRLTAGTNQEQ